MDIGLLNHITELKSDVVDAEIALEKQIADFNMSDFAIELERKRIAALTLKYYEAYAKEEQKLKEYMKTLSL